MGTDTLDLLLKYLYDNRRYQYIDEIHANFSKIHEMPIIDILVMLNKLIKDGYITDEIHLITKESMYKGVARVKQEDRSSYFITFDGVLFVENALIWKYRPYKWNASKQIAKTAWMALKIIMIFLNAIAIIVLTYLQIKK